MQPILYALLAVLLYAIGNNVVSKYLRTTAPTANALLMCFGMAIAAGIAFLSQRMLRSDVVLPAISLWWVYAILGAVYATADILFFKAYTLQGSLASLMTVVALMPAAAVLIEYVAFKGAAPSLRQSAGIACAVLAVWLVSTR